MGEYEDRYPDAYRDNERAGTPSAPYPPGVAPAPRQTREQPLRTAFGATAAGATENSAAGAAEPRWRHAPSTADRITEAESIAGTARISSGDCRGRGPRGYTRSPGRIYEDICDRLTEDPFIDASDIDVAVGTAGVVLAGSVETEDMLQRAETMTREISGVSRVQNALTIRPSTIRSASRPIDR